AGDSAPCSMSAASGSCCSRAPGVARAARPRAQRRASITWSSTSTESARAATSRIRAITGAKRGRSSRRARCWCDPTVRWPGAAVTARPIQTPSCAAYCEACCRSADLGLLGPNVHGHQHESGLLRDDGPLERLALAHLRPFDVGDDEVDDEDQDDDG